MRLCVKIIFEMKKHISILFAILTLTACFAPVDAPPPPPTALITDTPPSGPPTPMNVTATSTLLPATAASIPSQTPAPVAELAINDLPIRLTAMPEAFTPDLCTDTRALQLLLDLQTALQTRDGERLASLVSPATGVGVRYIRNGNVVTYFDNIKFIFETTYQADWGLSPGSGEPVKGAFQDIVLPSLEAVFSSNAIVTCNSLKVGGATYTPEWPYTGMDFYSVHLPGTDQYAGMDWETWAVGMVRQEGKPVLAALVRYAWEP